MWFADRAVQRHAGRRQDFTITAATFNDIVRITDLGRSFWGCQGIEVCRMGGLNSGHMEREKSRSGGAT
ncbi:hypothetical protein ES708_34969 [subsurface metagenome]